MFCLPNLLIKIVIERLDRVGPRRSETGTCGGDKLRESVVSVWRVAMMT